MKFPYSLRLLAIICAFAFPAAAHALDLDFNLVNKTGYEIKEIYVSPASENSWQQDLLSEPLADGETLEISFSPDSDAAKWDMKIVWVDPGEDVVWQALNLTQISKLTLFYDADSDKTTAEAE